jgi:AcrR family transcriptional regulator
MTTETQSTTALPQAAAAIKSTTIPHSIVSRLDPVVLKVFSRGDFHRVDMRTIAKQAGMSFTTIYRYFKDKETLLFWFIVHWLKALPQAAIAGIEAHEGDPLAQLKNSLVVHFDFYEKHPDVGRIIFMTVPLERWMRDPTYKYEAPAQRIFSVIVSGQKQGVIRRDVSPHLVMDLIFGLFNRTFLMWEFHGRVDSLVGKADACFDLIVGGIGNRAEK